jgi:hypothetical protein
VSRLSSSVRVALGIFGSGYALQVAVGLYLFARPATAAVTAASQGDVALSVTLSLIVWVLAHMVVHAFGGASGAFAVVGMCWVLLLTMTAAADRPWLLHAQQVLLARFAGARERQAGNSGGHLTSVLDDPGNFVWTRLKVLLWWLPAAALYATLPQARDLAAFPWHRPKE